MSSPQVAQQATASAEASRTQENEKNDGLTASSASSASSSEPPAVTRLAQRKPIFERRMTRSQTGAPIRRRVLADESPPPPTSTPKKSSAKANEGTATSATLPQPRTKSGGSKKRTGSGLDTPAPKRAALSNSDSTPPSPHTPLPPLGSALSSSSTSSSSSSTGGVAGWRPGGVSGWQPKSVAGWEPPQPQPSDRQPQSWPRSSGRPGPTLPVPVPNLMKKSRGRRVPISLPGPAPEEVTQQSEPGSPRTYVCIVEGCGKCFHRGEHLKRHIRSLHTYDKPFKCTYPDCDKFFNRRDNLVQHLKVHRSNGHDSQQQSPSPESDVPEPPAYKDASTSPRFKDAATSPRHPESRRSGAHSGATGRAPPRQDQQPNGQQNFTFLQQTMYYPPPSVYAPPSGYPHPGSFQPSSLMTNGSTVGHGFVGFAEPSSHHHLHHPAYAAVSDVRTEIPGPPASPALVYPASEPDHEHERDREGEVSSGASVASGELAGSMAMSVPVPVDPALQQYDARVFEPGLGQGQVGMQAYVGLGVGDGVGRGW